LNNHGNTRLRKHSVLRRLLAQLKLEVEHLDRRIEEAEGLINKTARESEACRRLDAILLP